MAATDQELLDAARDKLLEVITGGVEAFGEGGESARILQIEKLESLIQRLEARINATNGNVFKPIREVSY